MTALQSVSRETSERLELLESLIKKWNPKINLVSKGSLADIYHRHILDSVHVFDLGELEQGVWCDLGSGGGFPGLVVAVMAKGAGYDYDLKLVESDGRKAAFLREAARQLEVGGTVINARIEEIASLSAGVISARALGPLTLLCGYAARHLEEGGRALFPKGKSYPAEVSEARVHWAFDLKVHPSKTDPDAAILELRNIQHV